LRAALSGRPRLAERLFTPAERAWCLRRHDPVPAYAARVAAKEAVGKLLGTGITSWQEIEVTPGPPPGILLSGRAQAVARERGLGPIALSLTHSRMVAVATAGALGREGRPPGTPSASGAPGQGAAAAVGTEQGGEPVGHGAEHILRVKGLHERSSGFSPEQMRELDRRTIEDMGIPGPVLMERAALGVTATVLERFPGRHALIVCGRGNNGGDGLAAARQLHLAGHPVACVVAASSAEDLTPDAALNLKAAQAVGVNLRLEQVPDYLWQESELVVDCLLGTGASGELREPYASWAARIDRAGERGVPILAVDVPSGVDAGDGSVAAGAVAASVTLTFHTPKSGLLAPPGSEAAGEVLVWDIGIPRWLEPEPDVRVVRADEVRIPGRRPDDHKYRAGFVAVVAGSRAFPGAALLTAQGAAVSGAGYVRLVAPAGVVDLLRERSLEVVVREAGAGYALAEPEKALEAVSDPSIGSLVVGPGLGRSEVTAAVVRALVRQSGKAAIIDADGLLAFAGRPEELAEHRGLVLTPHAGELAALLDEETRSVQRSHLAAARRGADATGQVVLLKGSTTVVACPGGETWTVPGGGPQLASAGTGDVLSGVIGTFLAKGMAPAEAAIGGAWVHAEAGRRAAVGRQGGVLARDVLEHLAGVVDQRSYERRPGWRN
jgi:ADP-dependent NAD(P)H-hydrate dehydratase / NAD(P)H-hydrate epimerase